MSAGLVGAVVFACVYGGALPGSDAPFREVVSRPGHNENVAPQSPTSH